MGVKRTESRRVRRETKDIFLNVRFEPSTYRKLVTLSQRHERTLAAEIRTAVKRHIAEQEKAA